MYKKYFIFALYLSKKKTRLCEFKNEHTYILMCNNRRCYSCSVHDEPINDDGYERFSTNIFFKRFQHVFRPACFIHKS